MLVGVLIMETRTKVGETKTTIFSKIHFSQYIMNRWEIFLTFLTVYYEQMGNI